MTIQKQQRVLIAINHLASGETDYLYRFIEESGRGTIQATLGDDYQKIEKLYGEKATLTKLIAALRNLGSRSDIKRIDLLILLHGSPGKLHFYDRARTAADVGTAISNLNIAPKLRLAYNTSCYGDSHSQDLIAGGFDTAIGSKKVNANAAVEFPLLLSMWQFDNRIVDCLAATKPLTGPSDAATELYAAVANPSWRGQVNSTKVLRGKKGIRISS